MLFLHCQNFLRHKYDDKYTIFGCEYATLEGIYLPSGSYKLFNFCRIIFSFEKGVVCAFFGIFRELFEVPAKILGLKMVNIEF